MKKTFFDKLKSMMFHNPDIYVIFAGLGYPRVDEFKELFPQRAINTEASEQTALDIAVGLAYAGKIPVVYTITPFLLRAFETIRTYIDHEKLHVVMVGAGRDDDYSKDDGFSHDATDIPYIFSRLSEIRTWYPQTEKDIEWMLKECIRLHNPSFISIRR